MKLRLLAGASVLSFVLGSLHAYSVLLIALESWLAASRAEVSFAYSLAIFSLACGVLMGPFILSRFTLSRAALVAGMIACGGIVLTAISQSVSGLAVGFGLLFGFGNGLGYSLFLTSAGRSLSKMPGTAIGIVSAVYSIGSLSFAVLLGFFVERMEINRLVFAWAACVATGAVIATVLIRGESAEAKTGKSLRGQQAAPLIMRYWIIYACGAAGALMVAGHAAGIVQNVELTATSAGPTLFAVGNIAGCVAAGFLVGKLSPGHSLATAGLISFAAFVALAMGMSAPVVLMLLAVTGSAYGALLTLIPALLARQLGTGAGAAAFGWVFTAWGAAGLCAPWLAGAIFDATGGYSLSMVLAALLAAVGIAVALSLPEDPSTSTEMAVG